MSNAGGRPSRLSSSFTEHFLLQHVAMPCSRERLQDCLKMSSIGRYGFWGWKFAHGIIYTDTACCSVKALQRDNTFFKTKRPLWKSSGYKIDLSSLCSCPSKLKLDSVMDLKSTLQHACIAADNLICKLNNWVWAWQAERYLYPSSGNPFTTQGGICLSSSSYSVTPSIFQRISCSSPCISKNLTFAVCVKSERSNSISPLQPAEGSIQRAWHCASDVCIFILQPEHGTMNLQQQPRQELSKSATKH